MSVVPSALMFLAVVPGLLATGAGAAGQWKFFAGGAYVAKLFDGMYAP